MDDVYLLLENKQPFLAYLTLMEAQQDLGFFSAHQKERSYSIMKLPITRLP